MENREASLQVCFKENWEHARHVENERIGFTQFFAMVVGVALTIAFQNSWETVLVPLAVFIWFLALLGLMLANRWGKTFDTHMGKAAEAARQLGMENYVVLPKTYLGFSRLHRTRFLFCYYYAAILSMASATIIYYTLIPDLTIGAVCAGVVFIVASLIIHYVPKKKNEDITPMPVLTPTLYKE